MIFEPAVVQETSSEHLPKEAELASKPPPVYVDIKRVRCARLATVAMASRIRAVPSPSTVRIALGTLNERMPLPSRLPQVQARLAVDARPQPLPQGEPDRDAKGRAHL